MDFNLTVVHDVNEITGGLFEPMVVCLVLASADLPRSKLLSSPFLRFVITRSILLFSILFVLKVGGNFFEMAPVLLWEGVW